MSKPCQHELVGVLWLDADAEAEGWTTVGAPSAWGVWTYGILLRETEYFYVLANTHDCEGDAWSGVNRIPKGTVYEVRSYGKIPCGQKLQ